jgi:hypothetical protein
LLRSDAILAMGRRRPDVMNAETLIESWTAMGICPATASLVAGAAL